MVKYMYYYTEHLNSTIFFIIITLYYNDFYL